MQVPSIFRRRSFCHAAVVTASLGALACTDTATGPVKSATAAAARGEDFTCLTTQAGQVADTALQCSAVPNLTVQQSGQIVLATGTSLQFKVGATTAGQQADLTLVLRNKALGINAAPLVIESAAIAYAAGTIADADPEHPALDCLTASGARCSSPSAQWHSIVPGDVAPKSGQVAAESLVIRYQQTDNVMRSATVKLVLRGVQTTDGSLKAYIFEVKTVKGTPRLSLQPADGVDFGVVAPGTAGKQVFAIANGGDAPLVVSAVQLGALDGTFAATSAAGTGAAHPGGSTWTLDPPLQLAPGENSEFSVLFSPKDDKKKSGQISFASNDPVAPKLQVTGNLHAPCIVMTPSGKLAFGAVVVGGQGGDALVTINNCGSAELVVSALDFLATAPNSGHFAIDLQAMYPLLGQQGPLSAANPLKLAMGKSAQFHVTFNPAAVAVDGVAETATLAATSNALVVPKLQLTGVGVTAVCPIAKVGVVQGEQVVPQTPVQLIGDKSIAPGSKVTKYKWTAQQPLGSNQLFAPGPNVANPIFQPNVAGNYTFCLDVWDANGVKACQPACTDVAVIPDKAIHVELLWNTPADPDQGDTGPGAGADLDLHFAHPLAALPDKDCDGQPDPWFSSQWDTFWFDPNPQWGSPNSTADNPSLDLDDTDGAGPENLSLADPEGTALDPAVYSIGVHYWHDHGFGPSSATIAIYVQSGLALQIVNVKLNPLDMWYVGKLNWPNVISGGSKKLFEPCS